MQNKNNILRGVAALSTGLAFSIAQPALADNRDRRDDRRENKQERREDRQERREDRRENKQERREDRRDDRFDNRNNFPRYNSQPRWNSQPNWTPQPRYNPQPQYIPQPNYNQQNVTVEGTVVSDFRGNGFTLRTNTGQQFFVQVRGGEASAISRGDVVRVFGQTNGNHFNALSMRILANR